jgi:hypothetical protein
MGPEGWIPCLQDFATYTWAGLIHFTPSQSISLWSTLVLSSHVRPFIQVVSLLQVPARNHFPTKYVHIVVSAGMSSVAAPSSLFQRTPLTTLLELLTVYLPRSYYGQADRRTWKKTLPFRFRGSLYSQNSGFQWPDAVRCCLQRSSVENIKDVARYETGNSIQQKPVLLYTRLPRILGWKTLSYGM